MWYKRQYDTSKSILSRVEAIPTCGKIKANKRVQESQYFAVHAKTVL